MRTEMIKVRSKGKVVEEVDVELFNEVSEAIEAKGEPIVLRWLNQQYKTDQVNAVRAKYNRPGSKKLLRKLVMEKGLVTPEEASVALEDGFEAFIALVDTHLAEAQEMVEAGEVEEIEE